MTKTKAPAKEYTIGKVRADQDRTHLQVREGRAKCGSALDPELTETGTKLPTCETCIRYAGLETKWGCEYCGLTLSQPPNVDEVWHMCSKKPGRGGGRRKMQRVTE